MSYGDGCSAPRVPSIRPNSSARPFRGVRDGVAPAPPRRNDRGTGIECAAAYGRCGSLLSWMRENLDAPLTVEALAERAGLSSRHFIRSFVAETGSTPTKAVERLRVEVARERVQSSGETIERVARSTGFRDPERMRRAFIRAFGQPPQSLRRCARIAREVRRTGLKARPRQSPRPP